MINISLLEILLIETAFDFAGGDVVILYASVHDDVGTIVNLSGRFDLRKGIEERIGEGSIDKINKEGYLDVKDKSGMNGGLGSYCCAITYSLSFVFFFTVLEPM